jgi:hypothetical protein
MRNIIQTTLICSSLLISAPLMAQSHGHHHGTKQETAAVGTLSPVTEKEAAWAEKEKKAYPLKTCVVSDEPLGSMGEPDAYVYRVAGKPDRLVLFCCAGCDEDFKADPAAHLAKIDQAKRDANKAGKAKDSAGHSGHRH